MLEFSWGDQEKERIFVGRIDYDEAEPILRELLPFKVSKLQKRVEVFGYKPKDAWTSGDTNFKLVRLVYNNKITVCCARYEIIGKWCVFESFSYTPIFLIISECFPGMFKSTPTAIEFLSIVSNTLKCTHIVFIPKETGKTPEFLTEADSLEDLQNIETIEEPVIFKEFYIQPNMYLYAFVMQRQSTDIDIGRSVTMAKELDWYYSGWKYSSKPNQRVPDALLPFFKIVTEASKIKKLDNFCNFIKKLLETSTRESDDKLMALKQIVGAEKISENGPLTTRMFKRLIKNREIVHSGDEKNPKLVELINWCSKKVYVDISRVPNAGNGLFARKSFEMGDVICAYGGVLSNRNTNDDLNLPESEIDARNAYTITLGDDFFTFSGWIIDSRRFFTVNETARWPNGFPWNEKLPVAPVYLKNGRIFNVDPTFIGNANLVIEPDPYLPNMPRIVLQATRDIIVGAEIYANYGSDYPWYGIYETQRGPQIAHPTIDELNRLGGPIMDASDRNMIADRAYKKGSIVTTYCSVSRYVNLTGVSEQQQKEYVFEDTFYPLEPTDYLIIDKGRWIKIARDYRRANVVKVLKGGVAVVKAMIDIKPGTVLLYKSAFASDTISRYEDLPRDEMMTKPYF